MITKMPLDYEIIGMEGKAPKFMTDDGVIYAQYGSQLRKSTDWFTTDELIYTFDGTPRQVRKLKDGTLVCGVGNKVFKSDENEGNFMVTLEMD